MDHHATRRAHFLMIHSVIKSMNSWLGGGERQTVGLGSELSLDTFPLDGMSGDRDAIGIATNNGVYIFLFKVMFRVFGGNDDVVCLDKFLMR